MEAILKFQLPEEQEQFYLCTQAATWKEVCFEVDQYLRSKLKYEELSDEEHRICEQLRTNLQDIMSDNNLNFD